MMTKRKFTTKQEGEPTPVYVTLEEVTELTGNRVCIRVGDSFDTQVIATVLSNGTLKLHKLGSKPAERLGLTVDHKTQCIRISD